MLRSTKSAPRCVAIAVSSHFLSVCSAAVLLTCPIFPRSLAPVRGLTVGYFDLEDVLKPDWCAWESQREWSMYKNRLGIVNELPASTLMSGLHELIKMQLRWYNTARVLHCAEIQLRWPLFCLTLICRKSALHIKWLFHCTTKTFYVIDL